MPNYHVSKHSGGGFQYKKEGARRAAGITKTQKEAEHEAKELLANSGGGEVKIHGLDGKIRDSDTVKPGNDPNPPKDKVH